MYISNCIFRITFLLKYSGCSVHCKDDVCDTYGSCTNGCEDGYWGENCEYLCPKNCQGCDKSSRMCIACLPNWAGNYCNSKYIETISISNYKIEKIK